ncbi:phage tail tape measure protein [Nostoc sp. CHAB 5836]|uniref:phage tail tape measure protein n=1 Tax=Nostoc sp. CHAB 5836 TaxID=2780404 RepID=UPI001E4C4897|nr:phage tail tape measure protein [Nostoc sp. CHAB 5836]MCC5618415.1 phage tail tape measure protein [Nostoc sp. CHAB 5836]
MADTTTTLRLKAVDDGAIATVNNVSTAFTGLTIGTTALALGFTGLKKASESSIGQFILGAQNAQKFGGAIGKLADVNSKALKSFSALSDITFLGGQALTLAKGVQDAAAVYARIPQTFELFRSSGVSTQSIEDFYTLADAVKGSEASLDAFAISAVQNLGRFEQAAARAGTILKSNTNFDAFGNAQRASQKEQLDNAFQVQDIVNSQLNNTVSSTGALLGQYEVLSSGFAKAADSQQVLAAGLKLTGIGRAGGVATDPGETLRLLGKTLNAYQLSATDASKAAAVLNSIVENGITTIPELSQGFGQAATTARAAGIGFNDLAASTAVLTTQGINTATALTGLQGVAGAIIQKTPDSQAALDKLSLNGKKIRFDQAEIQAKGFTQALIDLNTAAGGNAKVLQDIFPQEVAFRTVLALLAQDGQKLADTLSSVSSASAGSLDDVFKLATGDRISRFEQIANKFQELIIKIASSIAPVFESGINVLEKIAGFFSGLPEPVKQAVGQFIVFQISTRATAGAVTILFQTMLNLASTYLQVRAISLLLGGQLGKELAVVRDLIVQRKGLLAVALQLFGIDQRFRLGVEATTEAIGKQNIVTKAATAIRNKAGEVFNKNVAGFTGLDVGGAAEQGKKAVAEVAQSAKNVGIGIAEAVGAIPMPQILGADGKPFASGLGRVKQEADVVGRAIASSFENIKSIDAGAVVATAYDNVKQGAQKATNAIASTTVATAGATTTIAAHTVALTADELAERGLAQTRIFGRNVLFATAGPLGAINTLLATEISLKIVSAGATRGLAAAQGLLTGGSSLLANVLKGGVVGGFNLLRGGVNLAGNAISGLLGTLGPLGPLLAVGAAAIAIFREDLFGLRKASNEAAAGLDELFKSQADLSKKFGTEQRLLQFKAEIKPDASATLVETRLEQLRLSGDLTTGQFNQLRETLAKVGEQGQLTGEGLEKFKSQLEAIRQGATGTVEKGVGDQIGDFFKSIPGTAGNAIDFAVNSAVALASPGNLADPVGAVAKVSQNRQADQLLQNISKIGIATGDVGEQSLATAEKINQYNKALGLTVETNQKLKTGAKLTSEDLEREGQLFNGQKARNENLISGVEKNIADQKKVSESIKDPELKATFDERIKLLETERQTLEKRNEALKTSREEFTKYYTETLPGLRRAITESSNSQQALGNAQSNFQQQFKLDAEGKATPFLKDITTLKNEASQYQAQVLESYQAGLFEQLSGPTPDGKALLAPAGEAEFQVAERLRAVRDNKIKLPDGTEGFRLSVSDRLAATQQISEVRQASSKQISEVLKLEAEQIKLQQQQRVISTEDAEKQIAQIQLQGIGETLIQKEIEIKEYAQFPIRKAQLERDAAAIRVQIEQAVTLEENRQLEKRRGLRQEAFNVEIEQIKARQSERQITEKEAQTQISQIQIKASRDRLDNLLVDFNKSGGTSIELSNKIAIARAQLRQQEAAEIERLINVELERQKRLIANTTQIQTLALQRQGSGINTQVKDIEQRQQLIGSTAQLQGVLNQATESSLQNQLKLTQDSEKRAAIETKIAQNRVLNLEPVQQQERISLAVQTQINKLNLERETIQLRIQKIENQRQIAEINLELIRAKRDKRSPEEIKSIELQIDGARQQSDLLSEQGDRLERSKIALAQIAENSKQELQIKQGIARTDAEIELTLTRRRNLLFSLEKQTKDIEIASQQINLAGQIQINQSEALVKNYDQQKSLLQGVQNAIKGRLDFVTGELGIAGQLATKDSQRQEVAKITAALKLQSLESQLNLEGKVLDLNLKQQESQLKIEQSRNRSAVAQSQAGVAQAQVNLAKAQAEGTPQDIQLAQIGLQAKTEEAIALQYAGLQLEQQGKIQFLLGNVERQGFRDRSVLQRDQAKAEFIQTLPKGQQRRLARELREQSLGKALGVGRGDVAVTGQAVVNDTLSRFFGEGALEPLESFRAAGVRQRLNQGVPSLQLDFPDFEQFRQNQLARFQEFGYNLPLAKTLPQELSAQANATIMNAVGQLTELVNQKLSTPNSVTLEVPITNNFSTQDAATKTAANTTTQQIRQQLHDLGELLKRT